VEDPGCVDENESNEVGKRSQCVDHTRIKQSVRNSGVHHVASDGKDNLFAARRTRSLDRKTRSRPGVLVVVGREGKKL